MRAHEGAREKWKKRLLEFRLRPLRGYFAPAEMPPGRCGPAQWAFAQALMAYLPIEDHGLIGNMHTAALVARDVTIDWLCLPHVASPSVFDSILDDKKGVCFRVAPTAETGVT